MPPSLRIRRHTLPRPSHPPNQWYTYSLHDAMLLILVALGIARANSRREQLKDVVREGIMQQRDRDEFIAYATALPGEWQLFACTNPPLKIYGITITVGTWVAARARSCDEPTTTSSSPH